MRMAQKPIDNSVPPLLCVFLLIALQWISLLIGRSTCLSADGIALIFFKNMFIDDPYNAMGDWNATDDSPCAWNGVSCSLSTEQAGGTSSVVSLDLAGKMLTGNISPALGALASLQTLKLQGNLINGTLPVQLFNATALQTLLLGGNNITSLLPSEIGNLINLKVFDISSNRMYGFIPVSLTKCRQLQTLLLARNLFTGPIIDGFGANFNSLQQLDLSSNLLSGSIPADLGKLSALRGTLNLSYNHLLGTIPVSLGSLPYTVSLDLSHNNLTGRIPQAGSLAEQGPGPFLFNPGLCGFPLNIVCPITPFQSPLPSLPTEASSPYKPITQGRAEQRNSTSTPKPSLRPGVIAAIALGDAAALSVFATLYIYLYWKARSCKEDLLSSCAKEDITKQASKLRCFHTASTQEESEASPLSEKDTEQGELVTLDKRFSFDIDELLRASAYVLGKSGQSIVYKVVLGNGTPVVVRRLGEASTQSKKDFEGEVQAIGKLRHPNVVRLLAYCWANDEKLLVYEYISHGSLAAALNGNSPQHPSRMLTWEERLRIARGMARGLAYLHESNSRKCIHAEIRTTKILLDSHMCPYIADFGVARLAAAQSRIDSIMGGAGPTSSIHSNALEWSGPQTRASTSWIENMYRAPEAKAAVPPPTAKPTQKWDVYAYGVVAMELVCGRARALQMGMAGVDFVGWMRRSAAKEGGAQVMVDPAIAGAEGLQSMAVLLSLAVACTSASPDHRPKMRTIADALDKLVSA